MSTKSKSAQICYDPANEQHFVRVWSGENSTDEPIGDGTREECVEYCEVEGLTWEETEESKNA